MKLLLIEDSEGDAMLVTHLLQQAVPDTLEIDRTIRLRDGIGFLQQKSYDIILLDLSLPDSHGLQTLREFRTTEPDKPVVVLTGQDDEQLGVEALRLGAQDYLVKGQTEGKLLARTLQYAIERQNLLNQLDQARSVVDHERELHILESLSSRTTPVTAAAFGNQPLRAHSQALFENLINDYGQGLANAVEQRAYRVEYDVDGLLRNLAGQMGFVKAGPRDVIEIHTEALRRRVAGLNPQLQKVYIEEGRLIVLRLMGELLAYYRRYFIPRVEQSD